MAEADHSGLQKTLRELGRENGWASAIVGFGKLAEGQVRGKAPLLASKNVSFTSLFQATLLDALYQPLGLLKSGARSLSRVTLFWIPGSSPFQNLTLMILSSLYSEVSMSS